MRRTIMTFAALAFCAAGTIGQAKAADNFVVLFNDLTDHLHGMTWQNGILIQDVTFPVESYDGVYGLGWNPGGALASNVDASFNFYEGRALSDTFHIFGGQGDGVVNTAFYSDVDGGSALTALPGGINLQETGQPQTLLTFTLANGDHYTWQVASEVPESATWAMMLAGFGGIGVLGSIRARRAAASTASV